MSPQFSSGVGQSPARTYSRMNYGLLPQWGQTPVDCQFHSLVLRTV